MTDPELISAAVSDSDLLRAAIAASGLSVRGFAREVLVRDPRTVWRWLAGDTPIPLAVRTRLAQG